MMNLLEFFKKMSWFSIRVEKWDNITSINVISLRDKFIIYNFEEKKSFMKYEHYFLQINDK